MSIKLTALLTGLLCLTSAHAAENLRGSIFVLYPADLNLYGAARDWNNYSTTIHVRVCWDDPTLTHNCDNVIPANTSVLPYVSCSGQGCAGFHYPIPTGTVGSVTPRDGRPHMIYAEMVSPSNPGAGNTPIDGAPWPFTYKNGTAAPMWAAQLETSPSRLTADQLAVVANRLDPYSVGLLGKVVCTSGGVAVRDDGVAGYYVQQHNVPCANVFVVSVQVSQAIHQFTFESAIVPVLRTIPSSLQAIALAWVQPSIVGFTTAGTYPQSISGAVANGGMVAGGLCQNGGNVMGEGPVSGYFNSNSKAPFTDYGIRPTMMLAAETCLLCNLTNNYSFPWIADLPTAKKMINSAIAAVDTNPSGGNAYWAWTSDELRSITALVASPLSFGNALSPRVNTQVLGSITSPYPTTVSASNLLLYAQGAPHWLYAAPSFLSGAGIGYSVTSTSGALPSDTNQTTAASWISHGAVGAYGNAVEPCELLPYKHPDPAIVIPNYTQGQTLVESLWKAVRMPWGGNFLGDPLAAPFSLNGSQAPTLPTISTVNPGVASTGTSVNVTISGSNFITGASVNLSGAGVTVSNMSIVTSTQISATINVASNASTGPHNLSVSTPAGSSGSVLFNVNGPAAPTLPTLSSINPASATTSTTSFVTINGSNFASGATLTISGTGVTASNVLVVSSNQMTATFNVASNAAVGVHNVTISTAAGTTGAVSFNVAGAGSTKPAITSFNPPSAATGTIAKVMITGTNFVTGASLVISGSGVSASNVSVVNSSQIAVTFKINASAALGAHNVIVATSSGISAAAAFNVTGSAPSGANVTLSSVSVSTVAQGTKAKLVLTGTNFTAGSTVLAGGSGVLVSEVKVMSSTQIAASVTASPSTPTGNYTLTVKPLSGAVSNPVVFTVTAPIPPTGG